MLKINLESLPACEARNPGITTEVWRFENAILPTCTKCGSKDTADVQVGFVKMTMALSGITTKFRLHAFGPRPGRFYCNTCNKYFTPMTWGEPIRTTRRDY